MKKIFILLFASMSLSLFAQTPTTDCFTISNATLALDGTTSTVTVSLLSQWENNYTAYNLDIQLPEGVSVPMVKSGKKEKLDVNPVTGADAMHDDHTLSCSMLEGNILRVAVFSGANSEFNDYSGPLFTIGLVASPYTKPGTLSLSLSGQNLTTVEAVKYVPADVVYPCLTVSDQSSVALNILPEHHWSTCILPFATALPEGLQAYTCENVADGLTYLTAVNSMEAYTPYILYAENGFSGSLSGTVDPTLYPVSGVVEQGLLHGAIVSQSVNEGYILTYHEEVAFYLMDTEATYIIPEGKCWLTVPTGALADQRLVFTTEPFVTAIENIRMEVDAPCVDILGRAVAKPQQGSIYIRAGKKFIQK